VFGEGVFLHSAVEPWAGAVAEVLVCEVLEQTHEEIPGFWAICSSCCKGLIAAKGLLGVLAHDHAEVVGKVEAR